MNRLTQLLFNLEIDKFVFVDVGAKGKIETIAKLDQISEVHAFEPNPNEFALLKKRYATHAYKQLNLYDTGLYEKPGNTVFNISNNASMSSILAPDLYNYNKHFGRYKAFNKWASAITTNHSIDIILTTIDDCFSQKKDIDFLKIDTQGTELSILKGAEQHLSQGLIKVLKVEVSTIATYHNQPLFSDIDIYLRKHNYTLIDFVTYRENPSYLLGNDHEVHYAPCGDAYYMLNHQNNEKEIIKKAILVNLIGYKSLAENLLKTTNLEQAIIATLIRLSQRKDGSILKKIAIDLMPPVLAKMMKKSYF